MKKIDKNLLATYLNLESEKANQYLAKLADQICAEIVASDDNDEIFKDLELLEEFVYKVPKQAIAVARYIFAHPLQPKIIKILDGSIEGKRHEQVAEKAIELLNKIRYVDHGDVIPLLAEHIRSNGAGGGKAIEVIKNFSKYDFNYLTKIKSYAPQRTILDFVKKWIPEEQVANFDFVQVVAEELLSSSISGASMDAVDTLTFHSAAVQPTEFLKKIRREVMDLEFSLYNLVPDPAQKLKIVRVLEEASRGPVNAMYGDDLKQTLAEDGEYLLNLYRKIIFDKEGRLIAVFAVADEIEKRLYWLNRNQPDNKAAKLLRDEILAQESYKLFRLLVSDEARYYEEGGWDKAEATRNEAIKALIQSIDRPAQPWVAKLDEIASQINFIGEWQYRFFRSFLRNLAKTKPEIAKELLDQILQTGGSLKQFAMNILEGFREGQRLDLWDDAVAQIIKKSDAPLVAAIVYSLHTDASVDLQTVIRESDIALLEEIVKETGNFEFLTGRQERDANLRHAMINSLMRNYERDPAKIEELIIAEIERHPEYNNVYARNLHFGIVKRWIDYSRFSKKGVDFLVRWVIKLPDLDWDIQDFIVNLCQKDTRRIYDIFWGRIEASSLQKQKTLSIAERVRYEAVPYHISDRLRGFFAQDASAKSIIQELIGHATKEWSTINWDIGHLVERVGYSFKEILKDLLEKGDDVSLLKAVGLMNFVDGGELDLCMDIVGRTDNKSILDSIRSLIYATGVVSGEDGIARAFEAKARDMEQYIGNSNPRIDKFAKEMKHSFIESAKQEEKRVAEQKQLRKIEFEG